MSGLHPEGNLAMKLRPREGVGRSRQFHANHWMSVVIARLHQFQGRKSTQASECWPLGLSCGVELDCMIGSVGCLALLSLTDGCESEHLALALWSHRIGQDGMGLEG